jgi:hypothetical protein
MTVVDEDLFGRNETPLERCDRNLAELMQELRVVQTGVTVLFRLPADDPVLGTLQRVLT